MVPFARALIPLAAALCLFARADDATACGGCMGLPPTPQIRAPQVTGHRMVLSVSTQQTTLYDQISYTGEPESFAWVLPIKGEVDVGLSADLMLELLDAATALSVEAPIFQCPSTACPTSSYSAATGYFGSSSSSGTGGGVEVIAQEVVGPYETVQLSSQDPNALATWLTSHGYEVPDDVKPVIDAYVSEGFDFLALKLVPGQGISAMRPVRVTMPGASPVLPLRMTQAGTGAITPVSLWIFGEGRYEPKNFGTFEITESKLVWDFANLASNYKQLRAEGLAENDGATWLVEAAEPFASLTFKSELTTRVQLDPAGTGYADDMGVGATEACQADLDALFGGIAPASLWVTRIYAELPRPALAQDLVLGAATSQKPVDRLLEVTAYINEPACPPPPDCTGISGGDPSSGAGAAGSGTPEASGGGGCSVGVSRSWAPVVAALGLLALTAVGRRRRR